MECEVSDALKQVGLNVNRTGWLALRSVYEDVPHVCPYSDGYVQPCLHRESFLVALSRE